MAQEDELYLALAEERDAPPVARPAAA
jgi:hypothetical protein